MRPYICLILTMLLACPAISLGADDLDQRLFNLQKSFAEKGSPRDMYALAEMYEYGLGTESSFDKAIEWYEKSANKGYAPAKQKLAKRKEFEWQFEQGLSRKSLRAEPAAPAPAATPAPVAKAAPAPVAKPVIAKADKAASEEQERLRREEREKYIARRKAEIRQMILEQTKDHHEVFE
jgi:TPR repeat protein